MNYLTSRTPKPSRRQLGALLIAIVVPCGLNACSNDDTITPQDSAFAGIPTDIVNEVLASPAARERALDDDPAQSRSLWQGIALNFVQTRDAYTIYMTWRDTGTPPEVAPDLKIAEPLNGFTDYANDQNRLREIVTSGEIEQLRDYLTNDSAGGVWIPAKANDVKGPTVADATKQGL